MKANTTSVTITFRLNNDDIQGSIEAIKALLATLNESLTQTENPQQSETVTGSNSVKINPTLAPGRALVANQ